MTCTTVRRPMASHFEKGVDFGLVIHKSPYMADEKDHLVLSSYIFEFLEVNPGVAGFLIQLHSDDVDAVVESPRGALLVRTRPQRGGGSTDPKIVARNKVLCRRRRRRRFCFRHTAGGIFLVPPYVSILKILRILWRIQKWLKSTKKVM